jgi:hypothetical protein
MDDTIELAYQQWQRSLQGKGILDSELWHRPYAEALMETEPTRLARLIAEAERAILERYLELLCIAPEAIEPQAIDLENAVYHLSQLNKTARSAINS